MTDVGSNGQQGPEFPVEAQRCFQARTSWSEVIDRDACAVKKKAVITITASLRASALEAGLRQNAALKDEEALADGQQAAA